MKFDEYSERIILNPVDGLGGPVSFTPQVPQGPSPDIDINVTRRTANDGL